MKVHDVLSITLYDAETWAINRWNRDKGQTFEM